MIASTSTQSLQIPIRQRELFLDDLGIAQIHNLKRKMHQPIKKGAVIRPDCLIFARDSCYQIRSAPSWDPDEEVFRFVVVETAGPTGINTYWKSKDGLNWCPHPIEQEHNNNFSAKLRNRSMPLYVLLRDLTDADPSRRYKSLHHLGGKESLVPVVSRDLLRWESLDVPPIRSADECNLSFDEAEHLFIATTKVRGAYGRSVGLSTSEDFVHWAEVEQVFETDQLDQERGREIVRQYLEGPMPPLETQVPDESDPDWAWHHVNVYNMGVFRYEGLYIGLPAVYYRRGRRYARCTIGFTEIQLACSRDLKTWQRLGDRQPFVPYSPNGSGAYDLSKNLPPSNAVVRGDELWFYYTGIKYQGSARKLDSDLGAVCLAVLRRDGFMSLNAGRAEGVLLTEPLTVPGKKLFVNVNAYPDKDERYWRYGAEFRKNPDEKLPELQLGELRVEVVDEGDKVLAGSTPIRGDHPRALVGWQQGNIADHAGKVVRLRFKLRRARFYSYWFQ